MLARYHLNVHNTHTSNGKAVIEFGGPRKISVHASASADNEDTLVLEVIAEFDPKPTVLQVFQDLAAGILPRGSDPYDSLTERIAPGESLNRTVPFPEILPKPFRSFSGMLLGELSEAARRVATLYRWRTHTYPPERRPLSVRLPSFSFDGENWFPIPSQGSGRSWLKASVWLEDDRFRRTIQPLVTEGFEEPLGFDLLSEASELSASNPRGALIVAMAALEVGLKSFVGVVVPDAAWLAMEVPTPPIVRMLQEYLPTLPVRPLPLGNILPPPKATLDTIKEANDRRNSVTHTGTKTTSEFVANAVKAVADVLRLLDYYLGQDWATEHMTYEFAVALGLRERDELMERLMSDPIDPSSSTETTDT